MFQRRAKENKQMCQMVISAMEKTKRNKENRMVWGLGNIVVSLFLQGWSTKSSLLRQPLNRDLKSVKGQPFWCLEEELFRQRKQQEQRLWNGKEHGDHVGGTVRERVRGEVVRVIVESHIMESFGQRTLTLTLSEVESQ